MFQNFVYSKSIGCEISTPELQNHEIQMKNICYLETLRNSNFNTNVIGK